MSELRFLGDQLKTRCDACLSEFESTAKENKGEEEGKGPGRKRGRGPTFKIGGVMVNAKSFSAAVKELEPLEQALPSDSEQRSNWHIDIKYVYYFYQIFIIKNIFILYIYFIIIHIYIYILL